MSCCADIDEEEDLLAFLRSPAISIDAEFRDPQGQAGTFGDPHTIEDAAPALCSGHVPLAGEHIL